MIKKRQIYVYDFQTKSFWNWLRILKNHNVGVIRCFPNKLPEKNEQQ
jgi:hypothetical protein